MELFEDRATPEDLEVEITELDPHGENQSATRSLRRRAWSHRRLWMPLCAITTVTLFMLAFLSPFLAQSSRQSGAASTKTAAVSSHGVACSQSGDTIGVVVTAHDGAAFWNKQKILLGKPHVTVWSCIHVIVVQTLPNGNGTVSPLHISRKK